MTNYTKSLPILPPRHYTFRDAYRGRVWRSPTVVMCRELLSISVAAALFGFLLEHSLLFAIGVTCIIVSLCIMVVGSIITNRSRVSVIKDGLSATATFDRPKRLLLVHELLRGDREKTFVLRFTFENTEGVRKNGRVWVCGCARQYFPQGSKTPIAYDATREKSALPIRLAVMVAPH